MKHTYPDDYAAFHCLADQCPCTCCAGWAIEIEEETLARYREQQLKTVDFREKIFLQDDSPRKRCRNLTADGLCRLILEQGEGMLCETCRQFPRHREEFEGVREYSLSISCPEAARMLLSRRKPVQFYTAEDALPDDLEYDASEQAIYPDLFALRQNMLALLQEDSLDLPEKCRRILRDASALQDTLDGIESDPSCSGSNLETLFAVMEQWEYTSDVFPGILAKARERLFGNPPTASPLDYLGNSALELQLQQIILYFLYAYFCGSVYDAYYYGMAQLAVCAAIHIKLLCEAHQLEHASLQDDDVIRYTYLYARELEHSTPNMLATEAWMDTHRI